MQLLEDQVNNMYNSPKKEPTTKLNEDIEEESNEEDDDRYDNHGRSEDEQRKYDKVTGWITSLIMRRRFIKQRKSAIMVQKYLKKVIVWRKYHKDYLWERDSKRVALMEMYLSKKNDKKLVDGA